MYFLFCCLSEITKHFIIIFRSSNHLLGNYLTDSVLGKQYPSLPSPPPLHVRCYRKSAVVAGNARLCHASRDTTSSSSYHALTTTSISDDSGENVTGRRRNVTHPNCRQTYIMCVLAGVCVCVCIITCRRQTSITTTSTLAFICTKSSKSFDIYTFINSLPAIRPTASSKPPLLCVELRLNSTVAVSS